MNYYIYAPVDELLAKQIKNWRYNYDRDNVNNSIHVVVSEEEHDYANVKRLVIHVQNSVKNMNSINVQAGEIEIYNDWLICNIKENNKLKKFLQILHSNGKYFRNCCKPPYIPIINTYGMELTQEVIQHIRKDFKNKSFFIRQMCLFVNYSKVKAPEKIKMFNL